MNAIWVEGHWYFGNGGTDVGGHGYDHHVHVHYVHVQVDVHVQAAGDDFVHDFVTQVPILSDGPCVGDHCDRGDSLFH